MFGFGMPEMIIIVAITGIIAVIFALRKTNPQKKDISLSSGMNTPKQNSTSSKLGFILSAKFGLILILFLMPFINVSCGGMINIPLSGMDLASGTTIETKDPFSGKKDNHKVNAEPFAAVALGAAVLGLLAGFANGKPARIVNAISGGAGVIFLLLLKNKMARDLMREGGWMLSITYEAGFWMVMVLFMLAAGLSIYSISESKMEES